MTATPIRTILVDLTEEVHYRHEYSIEQINALVGRDVSALDDDEIYDIIEGTETGTEPVLVDITKNHSQGVVERDWFIEPTRN